VALAGALTFVLGLPEAKGFAQSSRSTIYATSFGAECTGTLLPGFGGGSVDYNAIQDAIDAAEAITGGATVVLPPGVCVLSQSVSLEVATPIVLKGTTSPSGSPLTTLTDPINPQYEGGDIAVTSDRNTIQDLILDQSNFGGTITVNANHTTVQHMTMLGGPQSFAAYFTGNSVNDKSEGNRLLNSTVVSLINRLVPIADGHPCGDGLVWAQQDGGLVQNVSFTGTRIALYEDTNTSLNGYTYHPGPQICDLDGFYITQPSSGITMSNLTMYGSGGVISNSSTVNGTSANITISNERVLAPTPGYGFALNGGSHGLLVRDVSGVKITGSNFDSGQQANSSIEFQPSTSAAGVVVSNSTVPRVSFYGAVATSTMPAAPSAADFEGDTFPGYIWPGRADTFVNGTGAPASFTVNGGAFANYLPNDLPYYGLFHGSVVSFTVSNLSGYPGPTKVTLP
jgi:hypothetical protein